jgi:hypothetical protein
LQIGLRRVTHYGRPGLLIPEGSRQLAGGKRSATTGEVRDPAGRMLVSSDAPQTRTVPEGRSKRRAQGAHGYCPANMTLSLCYLPCRSSARTRRLAACTTAISALSRRSCSRYSRTASGCAAFHRSGNNSWVFTLTSQGLSPGIQ